MNGTLRNVWSPTLMSTLPGIVGAGTGEPGTAGGKRGAHPCVLADATCGICVFKITITMNNTKKSAASHAPPYIATCIMLL
jgi:hypothetical protein